MTPFEIILCGLALAFCWVNYLNPFNLKPFSCLKCMAGWLSPAVYFGNMFYLHQYSAMHCVIALLYLAAGVFAGALFEAITMRWL